MMLADFESVWWRGTVMTREAYELLRRVKPEIRETIFGMFAMANVTEVRHVNHEYADLRSYDSLRIYGPGGASGEINF
jgi:hypothetical protein